MSRITCRACSKQFRTDSGHKWHLQHVHPPEEARRYMRAYLRGARAYHDAFEHGIQHDEITKVLAVEARATEDTIENQMNPMALNPDGYINMESVTDDLRWLEQEGVLPRHVPVDQIVDHSYVENALAELGKYSHPEHGTVQKYVAG